MPGPEPRPKARPATTFLRRLSLPLLIVLALLVAGARLLPQPPPDLSDFKRLFITSGVCDTPCLMGIRPGMSLLDAALLLDEHPWVGSSSMPHYFDEDTFIQWGWSGQQPGFIDSTARGQLFARSLDGTETGHEVYRVEIPTTLRMQALQTAFGDPARGVARYSFASGRLTYELGYFLMDTKAHVAIHVELACPIRLIHYYAPRRTWISQNDRASFGTYVPPQALPALCPAR